MHVAILGAGNGGVAAAADLTLRGHNVRLASRSAAALSAIIEQGGIRVSGAAGNGFVAPALVTSNIDSAIDGADVVMLVVPATAHEPYARLLAAHLQMGQVVFLNPGGTAGGLNFVRALRASGYVGDVRCCEVATLTYGSRLTEPGTVEVLLVARNVPFSAFPGRHLESLHSTIVELYPEIALAESVLETAFANLNAIEHPAQTLLNAGWIEHTGGDFLIYSQGTTAAVGRVIEATDRERIVIAKALGVKTVSFLKRFADVGYTTQSAIASQDVSRVIQTNELTKWVQAPQSLDHRYLHEDVGYGLVPMAELSKLVSVSTPTMEGLIALASIVSQRDYRTEGLTLHRMGLAGSALSDLDDFLWRGSA